jgi:SMC interacting uncharacterized protein involved in chromosome segregation
MEPKVKQLEETVAAKERVIQSLAADINHLRKELDKAKSSPKVESPSDSDVQEATDRVQLRLDSSRSFFGGRVRVTCLAIDRNNKEATLQINLVSEGKLTSESVKLGQSLNFSMGDSKFAFVFEEMHPSQITGRIVKF